ncbi:hypothetical protein ACNOYE_34715 [Nannocystaceae bacterium ST9]
MTSTKRPIDFQLALTKVLRSIADQVERLPNDTVRALASGDADVKLVVTVKPEREAGSLDAAPAASTSEVSFGELEAKLRACETRDAGLTLLAEAFATKRGLERFAKHLDASVQKHDTVEVLRDKVVSTTIGYRLRSAAIRGEP